MMLEESKDSIKALAVGLSGTSISMFSNSIKEWNEIGSAIGIWLGIILTGLSVIKVVMQMEQMRAAAKRGIK